jgi:hypothetical protein
VIEASDCSVVGIEVKASTTVTLAEFRWLTWLRDKLGDQFVAGFVLDAGQRSLAFGDRLTAAPISSLWPSAPERPRRGRQARK